MILFVFSSRVCEVDPKRSKMVLANESHEKTKQNS